MDYKLTNVLPKDGGTLDQDPEFMRDLRKILALEADIENVKRQQAEMKAEMERASAGGKVRRKL